MAAAMPSAVAAGAAMASIAAGAATAEAADACGGCSRLLTGDAYAVIDGTDGRAHHVRVREIEAFAHGPPAGGIVEVRRFGSPDDPQPALVLANRSDIGLDRQVSRARPGSTTAWSNASRCRSRWAGPGRKCGTSGGAGRISRSGRPRPPSRAAHYPTARHPRHAAAP
jgi:hypothetical protein